MSLARFAADFAEEHGDRARSRKGLFLSKALINAKTESMRPWERRPLGRANEVEESLDMADGVGSVGARLTPRGQAKAAMLAANDARPYLRERAEENLDYASGKIRASVIVLLANTIASPRGLYRIDERNHINAKAART